MRTSSDFIILGGGAVVSEFYLPAYGQLGWLDRVRVAEPSDRARATLQRAFPQVDIVPADFRQAIRTAAGEGFKGAIVALPNALHEEAVDLGLEQGLDVLCEKPLAMTADACLRLAERAERDARLLAVGMTRRFLPSVQAARDVLARGWLGELRSVEVDDGHAFAWSSESGGYFKRENGGVLANIGVHALDLVSYLCGALSPVAYHDDWQGGAEANARYELSTSSGVPVRVRVSYTHALDNGVRIAGTHGELSFDNAGASVRYRARDTALQADVTIQQPYRYGPWPVDLVSTFAEQLCDFQQSAERREAPRATASDAVATARLIDWAYDHHVAPKRASIVVASAAPRLQRGRIIVTGGTGFVGGYVLEALSSAGHADLVVPVRSYRSGANAGRFPVRFERADLLDPASLAHVFEGARYVFHLAYGRDGAEASRVNSDGTKHVVEAAIAARAEAVVVVSTAAVFGDRPADTVVDETAASLGTSEYERSKLQGEQWALSRAQNEHATRVTVINPACVYGPGGKTFTELPARLLRNRELCWIEDGRGIVNYVFVRNLADAIVRAAAEPAARGERLIVSDGSTTWRAFFTELFGDAVADLESHTAADLEALSRLGQPTLRDLGRAVVADPEVRRILRQNAHLGLLKNGVAKLFPNRFRRLQAVGRDNGRRIDQTSGTSSRPTPPAYLALLYGPSTTRITAAKAQRVLGWTPAVDLRSGQAAAREWLHEISLLTRETRRG